MTNVASRTEPPTTARRADSGSYDSDHPVHASRSLFIAAEPRTGSTLLSNALWASGIAGMPAEYFHSFFVFNFAKRWGTPKPDLRGRFGDARRLAADRGTRRDYFSLRPNSVPPFLNRLASERASDNGVFAVKTLYDDFHRVVLSIGLDHQQLPGEVQFVRMRRRDTLRQAVSGAKAEKTGRWHSTDPNHNPTTPTYSRGSIEQFKVEAARCGNGWRDYLESHGITPHEIWYEDLADDFKGELAKVFQFLGLDVPDPLPAAPLERTSNEIDDEWVERYLAGE